MAKKKNQSGTEPKFKLLNGTEQKSTPFIDKYVAFLESQGRRFDNMPYYKNSQYIEILALQQTMPHIDAQELMEVLNKYIALNQWSALIGVFYYQSPATFYKHYFEVIDSFQVQKILQDDDVAGILADKQTAEQIGFLLEQLSITWGEQFSYDVRVRLVARSFAAFDRFVELEEFKKLPDSIKSQFTRYQTVRNFYRYVEQHPKVTDRQKSPVLTMGYLRQVINKQLTGKDLIQQSSHHSSRRVFVRKVNEL